MDLFIHRNTAKGNQVKILEPRGDLQVFGPLGYSLYITATSIGFHSRNSVDTLDCSFLLQLTRGDGGWRVR